MKRFFLVVALAVASFLSSCAQMDPQEKTNREIFDRVYAQVKDKADLPMGALTIEIARQFLGTEYVGGTLEIEPEALQVFLDKTDCILFVELSSSFALTVKGKKIVQGAAPADAKPSYELLCHNIQNMRYRKGVVDGYASRIHYTSEWLIQNAGNGILREYTGDLGELYDQKFSFMTDHPKSYKQLVGDEAATAKVRATEEWLNEQTPYYILTQEDLRKPEIISQIKDGDIITFISKEVGLDLSHVALACADENGEMHFIHASMGGKKVMFEPRTLADYAKNGLRISRLNEEL